jgi:hypothetical protein
VLPNIKAKLTSFSEHASKFVRVCVQVVGLYEMVKKNRVSSFFLFFAYKVAIYLLWSV